MTLQQYPVYACFTPSAFSPPAAFACRAGEDDHRYCNVLSRPERSEVLACGDVFAYDRGLLQ